MKWKACLRSNRTRWRLASGGSSRDPMDIASPLSNWRRSSKVKSHFWRPSVLFRNPKSAHRPVADPAVKVCKLTWAQLCVHAVQTFVGRQKVFIPKFWFIKTTLYHRIRFGTNRTPVLGLTSGQTRCSCKSFCLCRVGSTDQKETSATLLVGFKLVMSWIHLKELFGKRSFV